jgi:apyrase
VSLILPDVGIQYNLYSVSYLGYGNDQARIAVSKKFLPSSLDLKILYNPCYNKGYKTTWEGDSSVTLLGIGSELLCKETIKSYLNVAKCDYASCGMNGVF